MQHQSPRLNSQIYYFSPYLDVRSKKTKGNQSKETKPTTKPAKRQKKDEESHGIESDIDFELSRQWSETSSSSSSDEEIEEPSRRRKNIKRKTNHFIDDEAECSSDDEDGEYEDASDIDNEGMSTNTIIYAYTLIKVNYNLLKFKTYYLYL